MNRLLSLFVICLCQLAPFAQAAWAADNYFPLAQEQEDETKYTLTLNTIPAGAGSFNRNSGGAFSAGESVYMYYYANTDFVFEYWQSGDTIVSHDRYFYFTMPDHDATLTAVFRYNPSNPGNPDSPDQTKRYTLTLNTKPQGAGSFNRSSGEQFTEGQSVSLRAYNNTDFVFSHWMENGEQIANSSSFNYTMPAHDATLTAVYNYQPGNPANPDTAQVYYTVTLKTKPAGAGTFNWSATTQRVANSADYVYAYANSDYVFREWQQDGKIVGTNQRYDFTMPAENMTLVAVYDYSPANPSNPGKNYWNEETGEVIVDDFTPGSLSSAVSNTIGGSSNRDKVQTMTIAGPINQSDWGVVNNYKNCTLLDLSRTYGMTYVPSYNFSGNTVLTSVMLPAGIEIIDYYAFRNCSSLSSISILAPTPPTIGDRAFEGIADSIVYVPADAIVLYQEADGWKDFTILPLATNVSSLEVNLPEGTNVDTYKDMFIELVNAKSGQKQRYVVTNRLTYTFNSLIHRTSYNVYLRNRQGDVLGQVDGIDIVDQDVSVTFPSLMVPRDLTLRVLTPTGDDVTGQTIITWFDNKDTYLTKGNTLTGQLEGVSVKYRVQLPQKLAMLYLLPTDATYEVQAANSITLTLAVIPQTTIGGRVLDIKTGQPLNGATVAVSQMLNGLYSKSFTTKTDNKGQWSLQVYEAKTDITASMDDYVSKTQSFETQAIVGGDLQSPTVIPDFELKDISGTTIAINLTYQPTGGELQEYYSDYANVAYTVYNATAGKNVTELNVQYPQIVLMEQLPAGTVLRVTATSKNQKFVPVTATATVDSLDRASVTLPIVQLGGITASFRQTDNPAVVGILYDGNGRLLKKYEYASATLNINELQDGQYTLVTMASTQLFSTVGSLSQFAEAGLREGVDYVKNSVTVRSGEMAAIENPLIPFLDESKLYYTGDGTSITVNKSQITTGNYLTITGHIDFKSAYADQVSDVKLIVDLPEECAFVDNSVMRGAQTATYTFADNQVIVPLDYYGERVRFCFIPTAGGEYTATGSVQFTRNGKTITQPIGNANFKVKDLEISLPSIVAKTTVPVSGTAVGKSTVDVYDNGTLLGQTKALANGAWATTVELINPYNLSTHSIYAKITTKDGVEMQSETKELTYDMNAIQIQKVTMYHYNPEMHTTFESVFDFQNPHTTPNQWTVYYPNKKFTYTVDFTNNSPEKVSNVILYVHAADGQIVPLYPTYDEKKDIWVADIDMGNRSDGYYPVNVSIDYDVFSEKVADRTAIDDNISELTNLVEDQKSEREFIIAEIEEEPSDNLQLLSLIGLLEQDDASIDDIITYVDNIVGDAIISEAISADEISELFKESETRFDDWQILAQDIVKESIDEVYINPEISFDDDFSFTQLLGDNSKTCEKEKLSSVNINELEENGFSKYYLTDGSEIYYLFGENIMQVVDVKNLTSYKITIVESINSRTNAKDVLRGFAGYVECGRRVISLIKDLYANRNNIGKGQMETNMSLIGEAINTLCCYYDGFREDLKYILDTQQKERVAEFSIQIEDQQKIKAATESSLKSYNEECKALNKEWNELINTYNEVALDNNLSPEVKNARLESLSSQIDAKVSRLSKVKNYITEETKALKKINKNILKLEKQLEAVKNNGKLLVKALNECPLKVVRGVKIPPFLRISGKIAGEFGIVLQAACIILDCYDTYDDLCAWVALMDGIETKIPCEANPQAALDLQNRINKSAGNHWATHVGTLLGEVTALGCSAAGGVFLSPTWWAEMIISAICEWSKMINLNTSLDAQVKYWMEIGQLQCKKDPCDGKPCPDGGGGGSGSGGPGGGGSGGGTGSGSSNDGVKIDPSGFVYEGVASNRLQGVMASCYYKETVEDMYGDLHENVVLWNAEDYAQQNPLFTDEYGMYRWDVPKGLWQVKFEKEGYQTTYSEWLPVPPPQLEVNIPMTQLLQPTVASAKAYSEGVEVTFDKYMNPETLTADHIIVTRNGAVADGTVELLNEEVAYEGQSQTYASKVRFTVPEDAPLLSTDEVMLTVKKTVESYAGMQMQDTYTQAFDVEPRVTMIAADSLINVGYGAERTITIAALPADASKGKKLTVKSLSQMIATVSCEELTLDENGQAELTITGELPGSTVLSYAVEGTDVEGMTTVAVKDASLLITMAPRASRISGTEVYRGTEIRLMSETEGAEIWYTLDGSCPCNTETALKYNPDEPIIIAGDSVKIKAIAIGHDLAESDISEFSYTLKTTALGYQLSEGWTWVSHNIEEGVPSTAFATNAERIVGQRNEMINDPVFGLVGGLSTLQPTEGYKLKLTSETSNQLKGYEFNARDHYVPLKQGWNWIGYPVNQAMTLSEALAYFEASEGDYLVGQDGYAEYIDGKWQGTLEGMMPGQGFVYKSATTSAIPFNTAIVSTASSRMGKRNYLIGSPWAPAKNLYPNVMPLTAEVYNEGVKVSEDDYVVGAFAESECRGVGQWKNGRLLMTVYGDLGEDIRFVATQRGSDRFYDITEHVNFTPDNIGSWHYPMQLTLGSEVTAVRKTFDGQLSVTPAVAHDYVSVSVGGRNISHLTFTAMNGQTVISVSNVGKSATIATGQLPDGIYIVTVQAEGQSYYKKVLKANN